MKWLFIILLAVNLIYLGWEIDRQTTMDMAQGQGALIIPPHVKKLVMLKELPSPPLPRRVPEEMTGDKTAPDDIKTGGEKSVSGDSSPADVMIEEKFARELVAQLPDISVTGPAYTLGNDTPMCFSFGPFPDDRQDKALKAWFEERHVLVQQRSEKDKENQLFWIYLAPRESLGGAMQAIADLKKKGIKDYRLIETGDLRHAISLGLYSTQASVNKRLNELNDKGYQPIVVPYREANVIYWLDVKLVKQRDVLNRMFLDYPSRYNSVPVSCSEIAIPLDTP